MGPESDHRDRRHARLARRLGYPAPPAGWVAPSGGTVVRTAGEVVDRLLVVRAVEAVGHGVDPGAATRWLALVGADAAMAPDEAAYLDDAVDGIRVEDAARRLGVEAACALAWTIGIVEALDWSAPVDDGVADVLPSPAAPAALAAALGAPALRPDAVIADEDALASRLLAGLAADPDLEIGESPGEVDPYVVRQRHRALRWLMGDPWT